MYTHILPKNTKRLLKKLKSTQFIKDFYLSGGTALSLQLGHRESEDLDFFSRKDFNPQKLQQNLEQIGELKQVVLEKATLNCFLLETQLQFLHYPYKLLEDKLKWEGIYLSSVLDIALTKLLTVSIRGGKKDFIDLYFLLQQFDLKLLIEKLQEKYTKVDYNLAHIIKSILYFQDAQNETMPRMHKDIDWEEIKKDLVIKVKEYKI